LLLNNSNFFRINLLYNKSWKSYPIERITNIEKIRTNGLSTTTREEHDRIGIRNPLLP
jgi:hypothetical protein